MTNATLSPEELVILSFGTTDDGAMADPIADKTLEDCERLLSLGLLSRGVSVEYIRIYHTTQAGLAALGRAVH